MLLALVWFQKAKFLPIAHCFSGDRNDGTHRECVLSEPGMDTLINNRPDSSPHDSIQANGDTQKRQDK